MSLFSKVSGFVAKRDLKLYDMEDSRNKLPINFQVHIMLSSMMKTHTVLLLPVPCIIGLSLRTVHHRHTHCAPGWALVSVLVCSSAAGIKHWPTATVRGVIWHRAYSLPSKEAKMRASRQELKQRQWRDAAYWVIEHELPSSYLATFPVQPRPTCPEMPFHSGKVWQLSIKKMPQM